VALAAVLLCCIAMTAANASIVPDVSKQFVHGSANQTYTEALIIVNNRGTLLLTTPKAPPKHSPDNNDDAKRAVCGRCSALM
jgi:hypothetical protein